MFWTSSNELSTILWEMRSMWSPSAWNFLAFSDFRRVFKAHVFSCSYEIVVKSSPQSGVSKDFKYTFEQGNWKPEVIGALLGRLQLSPNARVLTDPCSNIFSNNLWRKWKKKNTRIKNHKLRHQKSSFWKYNPSIWMPVGSVCLSQLFWVHWRQF